MAIVGEAHIIVRALTNKVDGDIRRGFAGISGAVAQEAGQRLGSSFSQGFNRSSSPDAFGKLADGLRAIAPTAAAAQKNFARLVKTGYAVQTALGVLLGGISAVLSGLVALIANAAGAAASLAIIGNAGFALAAGMIAARLALGGVGKALSALNRQSGGTAANTAAIEDAEIRLARVIEDNRTRLIDANNDVRDAQLALNEAIREGQEEIQQLGFEAEDAAISEKRAALELEKAREALARAQDLPPNSRARKEAELAYQEAELNLRKAQDLNSDLAKEQDRLARTGVSGTQGVIDANKELADAEANRARVVRDGIRDEADARKALADAQRGGGGGGANPFEGLNAAQIAFIQNLQRLKPLLDELKLSVSNAFLPPLTEAINLLADKAFPTIRDGLTLVAGATGQAAISFAQAVTDGTNLVLLGKLFESSARIIEIFGRAAGSLYGVILSVLNAAAPVAERFATHLENSFGRLDAYFKNAETGGRALNDFFKRSGDAAAQLGRIFGNVFAGFGGIINANLGPGTGGQFLLDWLEQATQAFADLKNSTNMTSFFSGVASNFQSISSSVGALLAELIKLGDNPAIGQTFDILKEGAPFVGKILEEGAAAGPVFAELIVALFEIGAALSDTLQIETFFATLTVFAKGVADFFNNELVQSILGIVGPIFAIGGAIATIGNIFVAARAVVVGYFLVFQAKIAALQLGLVRLNIGFATLSRSTNVFAAAMGRAGMATTKFLAGPLGIILTVITVIVGAMVLLYNTSDTFRARIDALFAQLQGVFTAVMPVIIAAMQPIIGFFITLAQNVLPVFISVLTTVFNTLGPIFSAAFTQIGAAFATVLPPLLAAFSELGAVLGGAFAQILPLLAQAFSTLLQALIPLGAMLITSLIPVIVQLVQAFVPLIATIITALVPVIVMLVEAFVPLITMIIEAVIPVIITLVEAFVPLITMIIQSIVPVIVTLVEAFVPLITMIIESVVPIIVMLVEAFVPLITMIINSVVPIIIMLVEAFVPLISMIMEMVMPVIAQLVESFMPIISTIIQMLVPVIKFLIEMFAAIIPPIMQIVLAIISFLIPIITTIITAFLGLIGFLPKIGQAFSDVWNGVISFFKGVANFMIGIVEGMVNGMINAINNFTRPFKDAISAVVGFFGGGNITFGNIPNIRLPRLADGGVVSPRGGGTIAQIAEAGRPERVEPLDTNGMSKRDKYMVDLIKAQRGAGTINITVNPSPGMDERELASAISREISFQMRRGAVA